MERTRESVDPKFTFAAHSDAPPKRLDFFTLSRGIQERFVASTHRGAPPAPILFAPAKKTRVLVWLGAGVLLTAAALATTRLGLGDASSALAFHRAPMLGVYAGLLFASAFAFVRAFAALHAMRSLPFVPGTYVYPSSVIDASTHQLRVFAMRDLVKQERQLNTFTFEFPGIKLVLPTKDVDAADAAERALARAHADLVKALEDEGPRSMAQIDPLFGGTVGSPLGPSEPFARLVPAWARFGWALALGLAVGVAPVAWALRNSASDARMFAAAQQENSVAAYRAYVAQGGKRSDEVSQVLLPRAELRDAEKAGTVDALLAYAKSHKGSKIQGEIDASLRKAMLGELEKAKAAGTVTALKEFAKKFPEHKLEPELRAAVHALYAAALEKYKATSPSADASAIVERALAYAEKSGSPDAEVRFRLRASKSLSNADEAARKSKYYQGEVSLPSKHFEADDLRGREDEVAKAVVEKFTGAFPADVLAVKAGAPIPDGDSLPAFKSPTVVVDYVVEWSRTQTVNMRPRGVFVGLNVQYEVSFVVPDGGKAMSVKLTSWRGPELWKFMDVPAEPRGERENKVYARMADVAFEQVERRALETWFKMPAEAKKK
jgi:hypothetical protein